MLTISLEKVCYVIAKARELDVKVAPEELDDEGMGRILEDYAGRSHARRAARASCAPRATTS